MKSGSEEAPQFSMPCSEAMFVVCFHKWAMKVLQSGSNTLICLDGPLCLMSSNQKNHAPYHFNSKRLI